MQTLPAGIHSPSATAKEVTITQPAEMLSVLPIRVTSSRNDGDLPRNHQTGQFSKRTSSGTRAKKLFPLIQESDPQPLFIL
jgi:hypothetical protein